MGRAALKGVANRERVLLEWLENHEHGEWATATHWLRPTESQKWEMVGFYRSALLWASAALGSTR